MSHSPEDDTISTEHLTGSEVNLTAPVPPQRGGSNSRALKIAGLTTLACLLVCSQVFTAYIVFDQRQQLKALQKESVKLGREYTRVTQVRTPMKMQMPMNSLLMNFETDQDPAAPKQSQTQKPASPPSRPDFPVIKTKCQIEATTGVGKFGSFKPQCDEKGQYHPMQCWHATGYCWCVDETGAAIKDTVSRARPECQALRRAATADVMPIIAD